MGSGRLWWRCVYGNEIFLAVPCLTWGVIRTTWTQRVVDLLRTVPLLLVVALAVWADVPVTVLEGVVLGAYTVVMNVAMYAVDKKRSREYSLGARGAEALVVATLLSPLALLTGSPASVAGVPASPLRSLCVLANVGASVYLAVELLLTQPFTDAWLCYPHPRTLASLVHGYCPQYLRVRFPDATPALRGACRWLDPWGHNARCNPDARGRTLHEEASATAHVVVHILLVSVVCYVVSIPSVLHTLRVGACTKLA